ncbi:MAG: general secretion pathway protein GspB [Proteobacteria bacterium]|nr:general secretion pathway protein GspB [Pseudomonadota bacterium]MBU1139772.1 general secretion pathway protein GspB [Pseudomonadota bacterium]
MSYILEALKKSEKERKKEGVPDLQADHSLPPVHRSEHNPPGKWLTGVVILLFLGGGGWFWWPGQDEDLPQSSKEQLVLLPPSVSAPPETSQVPVQVAPSANPADLSQEILEQDSLEVRQTETEARDKGTGTSVSPAVADSESASTQGRELEVQEDLPLLEETAEPVLPLLEELPAAVRSKIPELAFVGHVYADDAGKRLIIINNRIVREGDLVSKGLSLQQITRDGVIMRYGAVVFRVKLF